MPRMLHCRKLGRESEALESAPVPGELGQRILNEISKAGWEQWRAHQTMLINEKRLALRDPKTREYLREQMELFLFGGEAEQPAGYVPPSS